MDSVTHLFLGAALAGAIAPPAHRRAAMLAGAGLQSLPDIDVLPLLFADPVAEMTWHRGPTHSLLLLVPFGFLLWAWLRRRGGRVAAAPGRWLAIILACLLVHPLLDACTVYGTQLLWPLPVPPAMWATLFIIDPLLSLPLLLAVPVAAWLGMRRQARPWLVAALALNLGYLGWAAVAKLAVEREAARALAARGLADAPRFTVPMPFTTFAWRVVAMTPDGFLEGERSLVADRGPLRLRAYRSDTADLAAVAGYPAVRRLAWFNHGFMKAQQRDGRLVLTDLRMGAEPDYSFRFVVARADGDGWREVPPEALSWPWEARRRLPDLWARIWTEPVGEEGE
ncbi:metal-dependent hydrolase [Arenimonas composti]|uniref:Metal-dependent hydrolase n=1 Tax=Arenimonas composti TR7-09 = DSM 18010 TaxID=1121013 RepID=A0A091C2B1_9GAMM|nr:metal-dependent hydrolase [Arenimonas composti]KFN50770.1 hypothetical protein P873_05110 [Arenimonas composti TR7-09 = DSM 18010]